MSCYNDSKKKKKKNWLVLRCNGCGVKVNLYPDETDRLLKHDYMREHGWKAHKIGGKWVDYCPDCEKYFRDKESERETLGNIL